ncbi:MAG TPA: hypothetical protein VKD90_15195 [Gemmataceae bacterium]|nr:hypothetical protein [Gemmataceae bacterium]
MAAIQDLVDPSMLAPMQPPTPGLPPRPLPRIDFLTGKAADICNRFALGEQAALHLSTRQSPYEFLELLTEKKLYPDAVRLLANGLSKRDAVRWACLCLRESLGSGAPAKARPALEAAEAWVKSPTEENRRASMKAAEATGFGAPAGLAALAAFWSGGSITPPDAPVVPPDDNMTAEAVAGAVLLAAVGATPDEVPKRQQRYLLLGLTVACGA